MICHEAGNSKSNKPMNRGSNGSSDDWYYSTAATITTAFPVTYDGGVYALGGWAFPHTIGYTNNGRFGPNFEYTATPEPGTSLLLGSDLAGLAGALRHKLLL